MPRKKTEKKATDKPASRRRLAAPKIGLKTPHLDSVVERQGVRLSSPKAHPAEKTVRIKHDQEPETLIAPNITDAGPDAVHRRDVILIQGLASRRRQPRTIPIFFGEHQASPHQLLIEGPVAEIEEEEREVTAPTIRDWLAPFDFPPTIDWFVTAAGDLWVDEIEPENIWEQFTPGQAEQAFAERYGWWSKARAPFIRWESAEQSGDPLGSLLIKEQFTPAKYGWWQRLTDKVTVWRGRQKIRSLAREQRRQLQDQQAVAWEVPVLVPRVRPARVLAGLFSVMLVVTLPASLATLGRSWNKSVQNVKNSSQLALGDVEQALAASPTDQADAWLRASQSMNAANSSLRHVSSLAVAVSGLLPQTRELYAAARDILDAGQRAAEAGRLLTNGLNRALSATVSHPDERLSILSAYLDAAQPKLGQAAALIAGIKTGGLSADVRDKLSSLNQVIGDGQQSLREVQALSQFLLGVLGHDRIRDYLLVFQNNTELRPTGGFMGSIAEIEVDQGEVKKVRVPGGGPYDLRDQLLAHVAPPQPLQLVSARWEFQDANWFPDFPTSAKKISWFWSQAKQPTLDGVIAVNERVMEKLLVVTGPIALPDYGKTLTADNFLLETQKAVELEYDKTENKPKKIIGDLLNKVLAKIKTASRDEQLKYLAVLTDSLGTKDIQIYLRDQAEEQLAVRFGWAGELKQTPGDSLAVVEANIAGQKTDAAIAEDVQHQAVIGEDGSITDTVIITRTHQAQKGELFRGVNNVAYLRVYAPQGSQLLSASGFNPPPANLFKAIQPEDGQDADLAALVKNQRSGPAGVTITDEFDRTAFGGWVQLEPGQTSVTTFTYRLPFTAFDLAKWTTDATAAAKTEPNRAAYLLLLSSQSGKPDRHIDSQVVAPAAWHANWTNGDQLVGHGLLPGLAGNWDRDLAVAALYDLPHDPSQNAR